MAGEKVLKPIDPEWPEARALILIGTALGAGRTWAEVAVALGVSSAAEAKKRKRELERKITARQMAG